MCVRRLAVYKKDKRLKKTSRVIKPLDSEFKLLSSARYNVKENYLYLCICVYKNKGKLSPS